MVKFQDIDFQKPKPKPKPKPKAKWWPGVVDLKPGGGLWVRPKPGGVWTFEEKQKKPNQCTFL